MRGKFGNRWVEYMNLINLMDHPSNMEIDLYWYQGSNKKWTFDLTDHLMINIYVYIEDLDAYELHPKDEKAFNDLNDKC